MAEVELLVHLPRNHPAAVHSLGRAVAGKPVVRELVHSRAGDLSNSSVQRGLGNVAAQLDGARGRGAEAEEVRGQASNVGGGHGGTGDGPGAAVGPGAQDVGAGREDVDGGAKVGVLGEGVGLGGRADGADALLRAGGRGARVGGLVAGGGGEEVAGLDDGGGSLVDGVGRLAAEGHVHNDALLAALLARGVGGDEVHAGDDGGVGALSVLVEDLDGEELGLLGDAVGAGADGAGDVGAVALAVGVVVVGVVCEEGSATLELLVSLISPRFIDMAYVRAGYVRGAQHRCRCQ